MKSHSPLSCAGRPAGPAGSGRPPAPPTGRNRFTAMAAENSSLRVQCDSLYTLLVKCRDWLKLMGADLKKISEIEGRIRAVQRLGL